jgi:uncharacterized membrane protein YgcG
MLIKKTSFTAFGCIFLAAFIFITLLSNFVQVFASSEITKNYMQAININLREDGNKLNIEYQLEHVVAPNQKTRGVFIALPNSQDGVWTQYLIEDVSFKKAVADPWKNQKYQLINEWNEFRLRVGDENEFLTPGIYYYRITLGANKNPNLKYDFTLLSNWTEEVKDIKVFYGGQELCAGGRISCLASSTKFKFNTDREETSFVQKFIVDFWAYLAVLIVIISLSFLYWVIMLRDENRFLSDLQRPKFDPPNVTPWQASFMIEEYNTNVKNMILSYLLYLNYLRIITISKTDKDLKITLNKDLPTDQPVCGIFNQFVEAIISEGGITQGFKKVPLTGPKTTSIMLKVRSSLIDYYVRLPVLYSAANALVITVVIFMLLMVSFAFLRTPYLIGNSYSGLIIFGCFILFFALWVLISRWSKLSLDGKWLRRDCVQYAYYLNWGEKDKLDFSNNPQEGIQYYLRNVPYAAAFGILDKFNSYAAETMQVNDEMEIINLAASQVMILPIAASLSSGSAYSDGGGSASSGGFDGGGGSW